MPPKSKPKEDSIHLWQIAFVVFNFLNAPLVIGVRWFIRLKEHRSTCVQMNSSGAMQNRDKSRITAKATLTLRGR